jgi:hypothetical protein
MAYTINRTNGTILTTVSDGTIDTSTSLTFVGKNYAGYGEILNENFLRLLESHSNATAPGAPVTGQLWWDTQESLLKIFDGVTQTFKTISGATAAAISPASTVAGDLWFDTVNEQLKVSNGTSYILIGPAFSAGAGTSGTIVETIIDSNAISHVVVKLYVNDVVVSIVSKDATFTPVPAITGFATIVPGLNLSTGVAGSQLTGTASNAGLLDNVDSTGFIKKDITDTTSGHLSVTNDLGINIGSTSNLSLTTLTTDAFITNSTSNGNIVLRTNKAGVQNTPVLTINGSTSDITIAGGLMPTGTASNCGTTLARFATVYATTFNGTSTAAQYADVAERYSADAVYEAGTVVALGGAQEVTLATELSENVFGVVSTNPAHLMNAEAGDNDTHPAIAMIGRVPVKVIGLANKGDRLVAAGNGAARVALASEATAFNVIGRALEAKTTDGVALIEAVVTIK